MDKLKICHICLVIDVKMFNMESSSLSSYYLQIAGVNPRVSENLSPYACYECTALLTKYQFFKWKCMQGQAILYGLLNDKGQIAKEDLDQIDRTSFRIASNLNYSPCIKDQDFKCYVHSNSIVNVKDEIVDVKEEHLGVDDLCAFPNEDFSSDDEPLSHHKEKKEKNVNQHSEDEIRTSEVHSDSENLNKQQEEIEAVVPQKPKRGRPKKNVNNKILKKPKIKLDMNHDEHGTDEFVEQYCNIIILTIKEQQEEINKRKTSSNYLRSPFQCNFCYKGFIDTDAWNNHIAKHSPTAGDVECLICKFRFKTKRALLKHIVGHEKRYACKACPYVSTNNTQAKQHQGWHKGVTYTCQHCNEIFAKWTSYMSHVRIKHPSEFICGICGYSFISKLGLTMHKTMMHKDHIGSNEVGCPKLFCAECDVNFVSQEAYKRHMVMSVKHTKDKETINGCRECGESFSDPEQLRVHHRRRHARPRPRNYGKRQSDLRWPAPCVHCSEEIPNARKYWSHFRRAHPDKEYPIQKNYVCDICGKSFRANAFLVYHKRTHTEVRAYKCDHCGKAFHNRTNLQVHEKTHSDSRPYKCSLCCKAFKVKGALNRHFRCHTGDKPYECEVCGKAFSQSNSRKMHVRTVHLKQPTPYLSRNRMEKRKSVPPIETRASPTQTFSILFQ